MEKLRQGIVNLVNKQLNLPMSETQNLIFQQHLTSFLSDLRTTPVHPPYTWMIEKALQELDEEGGSTEDSISEFIKKEHHSLPRAHLTVLKHHLQRMTEKGELLRDYRGRFLLPCDSKNLKEKKEDPQDDVRTRESKDNHRGRARKGKEEDDDPDTIFLKDLRLPKKSTTKQNIKVTEGVGRSSNVTGYI